MDQAQKGANALSAGKYSEAIEHYTKAIQSNPGAVNYYIQRSMAYLRTAPPDNKAALADAEKATTLAYKRGSLELIVKAQLRRAIALYNLERYRDSEFVFDFVKRKDPKEKSLPIWESKIKKKIAEIEEGDERGVLTVKEVPEETSSEEKKEGSAPEQPQSQAQKEITQTPADKIKHEWYQNNEYIYFTLLAKGVPKDKVTIDVQARSLSISFPTQVGSTFDFSLDPLFAEIDPAQSTSNVMSTKVEIKLKKATAGIKWKDLEADASSVDSNDKPAPAISQPAAHSKPTAGPSYPTSSKSGPKDWDKLAKDLTAKKTDEEDDPDIEGDATNHFFKQLYERADPDTRRAMIKSFTESNGTALSTDWSTISKEKTATVPPDDMVAKKWGE